MKNIKTSIVLFFLAISSLSQAQYENKQIDLVDVQHYAFHLEIADTTDQIKAKANIKIRIKKKTNTLSLNLKNINTDGKGMCIQSITNQKGKPLAYTHKDDIVRIINKKNWKKNTVINLQISYSGIPEDGLYIRKSIYNKKTFFGDNWPNRAQYWLPVIDHPSDKARVTFHIIAPNHYKVIASGKLISEKALNTTQNIFHFKTEQPLPTKVIVMGAADFKIKALDTIKSIPVSSWIYKEAPDTGFDDYKPAVAVLKFYDSIIGPYSYTKLANVQSKTRFGGMENAGNIFYFEESVNGKKQVESLVAHEVAHQWFGNSVTEKNWRDIWLSEGFATYLTDVYLEYKYGEEKLKERMLMERNKVIKYSSNPNIKPIVYKEKENLFKLLNRNSYEKGAWVLHMLRTKIGDEKFFKILRVFFATYKNSNASTEDFIEIVHAISDQNLATFFKQWLYRADIPTLGINWEIKDKKLIVDIVQNKNPYQLELPIKIYNKEAIQIVNLYLDQSIQHFEFPLTMAAKDVKIQIDPEVKVLFKER